MTLARALLLSAVVMASFAPWHIRAAVACSCAFGPVPDDLRYVDMVFSGTVTEVAPWDHDGSSATLLPITFDVTHVWLGSATAETTVRTAASGASCGYTFEKGARYLVYAKGGQVSLCSPTQLYDDASVKLLERATGPGTPIAAETTRVEDVGDRGPGVLALAVMSATAAVALAVAGFFAFRRRHAH